ncbi:HTH domain-containing protein [Carboxylicivirga mesophila]|uniref:HTH domain-containing protein n=1 Tax=Carboxylicivirga mesophila TaxID=1166478 RepID=A0ABS5K461_9BACT|nr:HTH domain-containing protein [Carboxylicivirga mesophila]MBS2209820.1 HTH domain-containing protein [Carboxylicivirga mesophila]
MAKLTKTIELMERIDRLIKRNATGTPNELAERLNISKASLYRVIDVMKEFGAPIEYCIVKQSFVYTRNVAFYCGFYADELKAQELQALNGGFATLEKLTNINRKLFSVSKNETGIF